MMSSSTVVDSTVSHMAQPVSEKELRSWGDILADRRKPLADRYRALYGLRHASEDLSVDLIIEPLLSNMEDSTLLSHDLCYCLGQKGNPRAFNALVQVLHDYTKPLIVRHEAGEALGALGLQKAICHLLKYVKSEHVELAETCQLALQLLGHRTDPSHCLNTTQEQDQYSAEEDESSLLHCDTIKSVDPAPPFPRKPVSELREILLNCHESLYRRYRSMFTLRNIIVRADGDPLQKKEALQCLVDALPCKSSALFRHEVAFVLGQVERPDSVEALGARLEDRYESPMVRHECAEALGNIATERSQEFLTKYLNDFSPVVKESCLLGLDMAAYQNSQKQFQYAKVPRNA